MKLTTTLFAAMFALALLVTGAAIAQQYGLLLGAVVGIPLSVLVVYLVYSKQERA